MLNKKNIKKEISKILGIRLIFPPEKKVIKTREKIIDKPKVDRSQSSYQKTRKITLGLKDIPKKLPSVEKSTTQGTEKVKKSKYHSKRSKVIKSGTRKKHKNCN